jgi:diadenosine tetraphosphate (Ap4A) HIT family hydrolase
MELWISVKNIAENLKKFYNTDSVQVLIKDGEDSGQSVDHICIHILPYTKNTNIENIEDIGIYRLMF